MPRLPHAPNALVAALLMALAALATAPVRAGEPPAAATFDERFLAARDLAIGGQREQALAAYGALLQASPGNADVLVGRGRVHAWMQHWPEAEADLLAATHGSPTYGDAWSALGDLYLWSNRPALAAEAYGRWQALAPDDAAPYLARGRAWRALDDRAAARADFEAARQAGAAAAVVDALLASLAAEPPAVAAMPAAAATPGVVTAAGADALRFPEAPLVGSASNWGASVSLDHAAYGAGGPSFTDTAAVVRRRWQRGSLGLEALGTRRFGTSDHAFALDGYVDLWQAAYANVRWQYAPSARLYPGHRWRAELFQGVGHGWELSAGYDQLGFAEPVKLMSLGVGRYVGNWYLNLRHLHVPGTASDPASSDSDRVVARWYYAGDAARYGELYASGGSSEPSATVAPSRAVRHSWSVGGAWAVPIGQRLGLKVGVGTGYGAESQPYHYDSFSATLYTRW